MKLVFVFTLLIAFAAQSHSAIPLANFDGKAIDRSLALELAGRHELLNWKNCTVF